MKLSHNRTTRLLIEYYREYPDHVGRIPVLSNERWEEIFFQCFGEQPQDPDGFERPANNKPGTTDPRWTALFEQHFSLRAWRIAIRCSQRLANQKQSLEEAA